MVDRRRPDADADAEGPDTQHQTDQDRAVAAAEAITGAHAQTRELRERTHELLRDLRSFVGYELRRRAALGQLDPEDLQRDEVIDSAFASALQRLAGGLPIRDLAAYLRERARDMVQSEVRRVAQERRMFVSLDQTVGGGEGEDGEEITLADVIADARFREPEQMALDNESIAFLIEALEGVPDRWRTVFLQRAIHERSAREVAADENMDIDEVRRVTMQTREYLRERFRDVFGDDEMFAGLDS